jgi:hypothetical protein
MEDCAAWIRGLRSLDYTSELLRQKHRFQDASKIGKSAQAIGAHAESSVNFLGQAFSGAPRASYPPSTMQCSTLPRLQLFAAGGLANFKISDIMVRSGAVLAGPEHCDFRIGLDNFAESINHYINDHGYKILHVGQESSWDSEGSPWQSTVAVLGK